jgi:hypothetical protein
MDNTHDNPQKISDIMPNPTPTPPPNEDMPDLNEDKQSDLDLPGGKGLVSPELVPTQNS